MHGLLQSMEEAAARGWTFKAENVYTRLFDADVSLSRNALFGRFLLTDCTDLVFIDADISWQHTEFTRLMSHDADFVAGIYRAKRDDIEKYTVLWPKERNMQVDPATNYPLLEADGVGFGFVRITRVGLEQMIDKLKPCWVVDEMITTEKGEPVRTRAPWLFEYSWSGENRMSEDYTFCKRWREAGLKVWVDPSLYIDHIGKKTYCGNVIEHLRSETFKSISVEVA